VNEPYRTRRPAELLSGTFFLDLGGDHRDTVLVAGSGRSGTTWLSTLINHDNEHRFIFEPFHPEKVAACEPFHRKQYLRPEDDRAIYLEAAEKILSGKLRSRWADRFNRKPVARRRLVKDIRTSLLLGWMRRHFSGMPIVFILRHPCAVADSRLRLGWRDSLEEVMSQKQLVEDHLAPFEAEILAAEDPFERSVFLWCIENYVPLRQPGAEKLHVVFYEHLVSDPEKELSPLLGLPEGKRPEGEEPNSAIPSRQTPPYKGRPPSHPLSEGADPSPERIPPKGIPPKRLRGSEGARSPTEPDAARAFGWTERVGEGRRKRAAEITRLFGLDLIYGEGPMPRPEGISEFPGERG
jgi:hypothetical protein